MDLDKIFKFKVISKKKLYEDIKKNTDEAVRNAVDKVSNELHQDFKQRLISIKREYSDDSKGDPFYESLYSKYYGKDDKYSEEKLPELIKESVKYAKAKGYLTVYTSPMEIEQEDELRRFAQIVAYVRAFEDPVVGAIPDSLQRFVLGRGIKYKCPNEDVQFLLDFFWSSNNMEMYNKTLLWLLIVQSEYFPLYFRDPRTGDIKVREIQPLEIIKVETDPDDKASILSYKREYMNTKGTAYTKYYADIDYYDIKKKENKKSEFEGEKNWQGENVFVQFIKLMRNREVRGRVYLERVLKWAEWYKNWIIDRAIINHEKGRVVWLLILKGTQDDVWERFKTPPAGGTIKVCTPDREWKPVNANINADDAKEDGLFLLYQVAAGAGIPIHVLTQRTSETVYSSIRASDSPFSQFILDIQDTLMDGYLKPMFRMVIKSYIKANKIPKKIKIKKYVKEYLRDTFRNQYDRYTEGELSEQKMLRFIKILTESAIRDFEDDKSLKGSADLYKKVIRECRTLEDSYKNETLKLLENSNEKIKHKILVRAFEVFENGIEIEIDTETIPIDIVFPDMVKENMVDSARILEIHRNMGIVSKTTASSKAGYNSEQEKFLLKTEDFGEPEEEIKDPLKDTDDENLNDEPKEPLKTKDKKLDKDKKIVKK